MKARPRCTCEATPLNGPMGRFWDDPRTITKADGPRAQWPTGALLLPRIGDFSFRHRQKLSPTSARGRRRSSQSADRRGAGPRLLRSVAAARDLLWPDTG